MEAIHIGLEPNRLETLERMLAEGNCEFEEVMCRHSVIKKEVSRRIADLLVGCNAQEHYNFYELVLMVYLHVGDLPKVDQICSRKLSSSSLTTKEREVVISRFLYTCRKVSLSAEPSCIVALVEGWKRRFGVSSEYIEA